MENVLYIMHKDSKIVALTHKEAILQMEALEEQGWEHTSTIIPSLFIAHIFNNFHLNLKEEIERILLDL
jgi:iron-sulfur cluster repair protein YtfE (RIC family)